MYQTHRNNILKKLCVISLSVKSVCIVNLFGRAIYLTSCQSQNLIYKKLLLYSNCRFIIEIAFNEYVR